MSSCSIREGIDMKPCMIAAVSCMTLLYLQQYTLYGSLGSIDTRTATSLKALFNRKGLVRSLKPNRNIVEKVPRMVCPFNCTGFTFHPRVRLISPRGPSSSTAAVPNPYRINNFMHSVCIEPAFSFDLLSGFNGNMSEVTHSTS